MMTVVLADDHPIVRSGLTALLGSVAGFQVLAAVSDGHNASGRRSRVIPTYSSWTSACPDSTASRRPG